MRPDEVAAAAERRTGWRESLNTVEYPVGSPYGADDGCGRQRLTDAMILADAYLAQRAPLARLVQAARRVIAHNWAAPVPTPAFRELAEAIEPFREAPQ